MALDQILATFNASLAQCDNLIVNAHRKDAAGVSLLPVIDQQQITVAAFLNVFIAWETFLESSLTDLMTGIPTIGGGLPVKYVSPPSITAARDLVVGVMRYFDYGNHDNMRKIASLYFEGGYPYEPHLSAIFADLAELRTMRNYSAHITSTTQTALEALALRIFGGPRPSTDLYSMLMATDPRSATGETVFASYKRKLIVTAELIVRG